MYLKDVIPPVIGRWARKIQSRGKVYASYQEAAQACAAFGYEQETLVKVVYEKTRIYRDRLASRQPLIIAPAGARTALAVNLAAPQGLLRVLDFGGACGAHYFLARALLKSRVQMQWFVVETGAMARAGKPLENGELQFFDDLATARQGMGQVDLVLSSGTLQYVPEPYPTLEDLLDCRAACLFLTRLGLTTGLRELISVQESWFSENGPGPLPEGVAEGQARYPITISRKDELERIVGRAYDITLQFFEDRAVYTIGRQEIDMYGYFARLRQ